MRSGVSSYHFLSHRDHIMPLILFLGWSHVSSSEIINVGSRLDSCFQTKRKLKCSSWWSDIIGRILEIIPHHWLWFLISDSDSLCSVWQLWSWKETFIVDILCLLSFFRLLDSYFNGPLCLFRVVLVCVYNFLI